MTNPLFSPEEIREHAHPSVLEAGRALLRDEAALKKLEIIGTDTIATFRGTPDFTAVICRRPKTGINCACTCGFGYGSACEHIAAAMLAANSRPAIQTGLDLGTAAPSEEKPAGIESVKGTPVPRLYLREQEGLLIAELRFAYLDSNVEFHGRDRSREKLVTTPAGIVVWLERSMVKEMQFASLLKESGLMPFRSGTYTPAKDQVEWVRNTLPRLAVKGFEVFGTESLVSCRTAAVRPAMKLGVSSKNNGLAECSIDITYNAASVELGRVFDAIISGKKYVKLSDGSRGEIPDEWIEKLAVIFALAEKRPLANTLLLRESNALAIRTLESVADSSSWQGTRASGLRLLQEYQGPKNIPVPQGLKGVLRPYQHAGYEWCCFLQEFNAGGCLADDMGLGKTIQALSLLLREKERGASPKKSLLIVPTSLLFNWFREARTFAPTLLIMNYHGDDRKRYRSGDMDLADVVLTSYGTAQREIDLFKTLTFNYVLLDEAQAIKNPLSRTARMVRELKCRFRLALTGTPIENNLSELWSLFAFLNPGMLGPYSRFSAAFARPIEKERNGQRTQILRRLIDPCILRRTKSQVAKELPPKTEVIIKVPLLPRQRSLYDMTRDAYRSSIMRAIDTDGIDRARMHILQALTRLRQICCHPLLVDPSFKGDSCKFKALDDLLQNIIAEKHKALVFSQFVTALNLIRSSLDRQNIRHEYLTGKTVNRRLPVDNFQQNPDILLMLISLKAGGVGLNLTAADYVVMFDPWWNPAVENQAADRAHRIGQTRPVFVYKLIAEDSVEERVLELQQSKKELFDAIITAEASVFRKMQKEEIRRLFE